MLPKMIWLLHNKSKLKAVAQLLTLGSFPSIVSELEWGSGNPPVSRAGLPSELRGGGASVDLLGP